MNTSYRIRLVLFSTLRLSINRAMYLRNRTRSGLFKSKYIPVRVERPGISGSWRVHFAFPPSRSFLFFVRALTSPRILFSYLLSAAGDLVFFFHAKPNSPVSSRILQDYFLRDCAGRAGWETANVKPHA